MERFNMDKCAKRVCGKKEGQCEYGYTMESQKRVQRKPISIEQMRKKHPDKVQLLYKV